MRTFEWLTVQMWGTRPAFGQSGFWQKLGSEPSPPATTRHQTEADRPANAIDAHQARNEWFADSDLPIPYPFLSARFPSTSAICTAFSAAPLRRLSLTTHIEMPFSTVESWRMRDT